MLLLYRPGNQFVLNLFAASFQALGGSPVSSFTLRVMCGWSEKPRWAAICARGFSLISRAFHACRARVRALNADGERPNTCINPRDNPHGVSPLFSPHRVKPRDGFSIRSAASLSGQSAYSVSRSVNVDSRRLAASALFFSASRTIESGSATLARPGRNEYLSGKGRLSTTAPEAEKRLM